MENRGRQTGFAKQHTRAGKVWNGIELAFAFSSDTPGYTPGNGDA
jgi:hypothetical protein